MIEKWIKKISPRFYWMISFVLGATAMYVMLSYAQMLTTGKYIILAGDSLQIYAANMRMLIDNIINGENPWFSFSMSMGLNTALSLAFQMMSPFNILYLIFYDKDFNVITAAVIVLKTGLAAAMFQIFASKVLKAKGIHSILFSVFYGMCAFSVIYGVFNFMWLDGVYALPVVALAVYKAVKEGKFSLLTFSYAYIFIVQFYQGYMIGIFSLMYFVLLLVLFKKEERVMKPVKYVLHYLLSLVSAVLISAVIWVPLALFLLHYHPTDSTVFEVMNTDLLGVGNHLFWGAFQNLYDSPFIYCGIPALLLFPFFFLNKEIDKRERIIAGVLVAFFFAACIFLPLYKLMHAFDAPDMWGFRFSFILSFLICAVSCRESQYIPTIGFKRLGAYVLFLFGLFFLEQQLEKATYGTFVYNTGRNLAVNLGLTALWILLVFLYEKKEQWRTTLVALMIFAGMAECITNGSVRLSDSFFRESFMKEDYYYAWYEDMELSTGAIDSVGDSDFYRTIILSDMGKNSDSFWGYNGVSDFGTAENQNLREFLDSMGVYTTIRRTFATGYTPSLEMLLSVKIRGKIYTGMKMAGYDAQPVISENKYRLPVGFMVDEKALSEVEMTNNAFVNQNRVFAALTGEESVDLYKPVEEDKITYEENGLILTGENKNLFLRSGVEDGNMVIRVKDVDDSVYMQIVSNEPKDLIQGVYVSLVENMNEEEDNSAWIPAAYKLWRTNNDHYIQLYTSGNFDIMFETAGIHIYRSDEKVLGEIFEDLNRESLQVEEWEDGYVKGTIQTSGERKVLFTSIPYVEGWDVKVDGIRVPVVPVLNDTFVGVVIPKEGVHEIELRYRCPGQWAGVFCMLAGIVLFAVLIYTEYKKKSKGNAVVNDNVTEKQGE